MLSFKADFKYLFSAGRSVFYHSTIFKCAKSFLTLLLQQPFPKIGFDPGMEHRRFVFGGQKMLFSLQICIFSASLSHLRELRDVTNGFHNCNQRLQSSCKKELLGSLKRSSQLETTANFSQTASHEKTHDVEEHKLAPA